MNRSIIEVTIDKEKEIRDLSDHNLIKVKIKGISVKRKIFRQGKATQYYAKKKENMNKVKEVEKMTGRNIREMSERMMQVAIK